MIQIQKNKNQKLIVQMFHPTISLYHQGSQLPQKKKMRKKMLLIYLERQEKNH